MADAICACKSKRPRGFENGFHVAGDLDLSPDLSDDAFIIDEKRGAFHAHVASAVQAFLDPHAIILRGLDVGIRSQGDRQTVFFSKFLVRLDAVLRYADDGYSSELNLCFSSENEIASLVQPEVSSLG